jgi:hypothetical protein
VVSPIGNVEALPGLRALIPWATNPSHPHQTSFDENARVNSSHNDPHTTTLFTERMRDYTLKEKAKITAGAVAALVIVAWLAVFALALLSTG